MITKELKPIYDSHKSFYGKANVCEFDDFILLHSYGTDVCCISKLTGDISINGDEMWYSNTTVRHIKEFIHQYANISCTKDDLRKYVTHFLG